MILLLLLACGRRDPIVGTWQASGGKGSVEFGSGGGATVRDAGDTTLTPNWTRVDADHVRIEGVIPGGERHAEVIQVAIDGDTLTIANSGGGVTTYRRVP